MIGLTRREMILAVVTGVLLLSLAGRTLWTEFFGVGRQLRQLRVNLQQQVSRLENRVARQKKLEAQLETFKTRSLPGDSAVARSVYGNWLLEVAKKSGWRNTFLDIGDSRAGGFYSSLRFNLKGETNWDGLVQFLYAFYANNWLHRIRSLSLQPKERGEQMEINLSVEAIALHDAASGTSLPTLPPLTLSAGDQQTYRKALAQRNLFAPYSPPREPPRPVVSSPPVSTPPPPPPFDASRFAFLTGIVGPPDQLEAWIYSRAEGKLYVLREGDRFQLGLLRGQLVRVELRAVEIESEGRRWRVAIGESLRPTMASPASPEVGLLPRPATPPDSTVVPVQGGGPSLPEQGPLTPASG